MLKLYRLSLAVGVILTLWVVSATTATFTVNSVQDRPDALPGDGLAADHLIADSAHCTLRAAVEEAGALPGPDTVLLSGAVSPLNLSLGELILSDDGTVIRGDGAVVIDALDNARYRPTFVISSDSNVIAGVIIRRSRGEAVIVEGSYNRIGETGESGRNTITGSGLDNDNAAAILIRGASAVGNVVINNWIGIDGNGGHVNSNRNGICLKDDASGNLIGGTAAGSGNLISGNDGYGVSIETGAFSNQLAGNFIGVDVNGIGAASNGGSGVQLITGAHDNLIGGQNLNEGNLISGNGGDGVLLTGSTVTQNTVNGNRVGLDINGTFETSNGGNGIKLTSGAHHNLIGGTEINSGNVISGNAGNGIHIDGLGADHNLIQANWVGLQLNGYSDAGNGQVAGDGILIDGGARFNQIGGSTYYERNVVSGNYGAGVHLDGVGTEENIVIGNFVGTNYTGTSSVFNDVGITISNGARYNEIGRDIDSTGNVLSGNRAEFFPFGAGVLIYGVGTDFNLVRGNLIGLDVTGLRALRNGSCGVIIGEGAQHNVIGGETAAETNYIAGNNSVGPIAGLASGVHLFGPNTSYNRIIGNYVGIGPTDPQAALDNWGHGVGLFAGASRNEIGGNTAGSGNYITASQGHGIIVSGTATRENLIRFNRITDNDSLGIAVRDGAQDGIAAPSITFVGLAEAGSRRITGQNAPPGATVDIYAVISADPSGAGEGFSLLGSGTADSVGAFDFIIPADEPDPLTVTAIAVDADNNSSAFALNRTSGDVTAVEEPSSATVPLVFELSQNYPNPFNAGTVISFTVPAREHACLNIYNTLGQRVTTLVDEYLPPDSYTIFWDGFNDSGQPVATGLYFYRLSTDDRVETRKMILLK